MLLSTIFLLQYLYLFVNALKLKSTFLSMNIILFHLNIITIGNFQNIINICFKVKHKTKTTVVICCISALRFCFVFY